MYRSKELSCPTDIQKLYNIFWLVSLIDTDPGWDLHPTTGSHDSFWSLASLIQYDQEVQQTTLNTKNPCPASTPGASGWSLICVWDSSGSSSLALHMALAMSMLLLYLAQIWPRVSQTRAPWVLLFDLFVIFLYREDFFHSPAHSSQASFRRLSLALPEGWPPSTNFLTHHMTKNVEYFAGSASLKIQVNIRGMNGNWTARICCVDCMHAYLHRSDTCKRHTITGLRSLQQYCMMVTSVKAGP